MEELWGNIFFRLGIYLALIMIATYVTIKWLVPYIKKAVAERKEEKEKKRKEIPDEVIDPPVNTVELSTKGSHKYLKKEEVTHNENYHEVSYLENDEQASEQGEQVASEQASDQNEEFEQFLKNLENKNNKNIKTQIKSSSTKLKAIIMSGALQDKKYKD